MNYTLHTEKSWAATQRELSEEFRKWGISTWDTNTPKGSWKTGGNQPLEDRTVILSYQKNGATVTLTMDKQPRAIDNLRVLFKAIEAMRLNEKRGIADTVAKAYMQLGAPSTFDPYQILGLQKGLPISVYEAQYKELAKKNHTDLGGSPEKMKEINEAIAAIRKEL